MSVVVHARVIEQLTKLRLRYVAERLDAILAEAARSEPTYLDFLDTVLREEVDAKQRTRVTMALKIAHFPTVKTLDAFDFKFQPSIDQRLVRERRLPRHVRAAAVTQCCHRHLSDRTCAHPYERRPRAAPPAAFAATGLCHAAGSGTAPVAAQGQARRRSLVVSSDYLRGGPTASP